MKLTAQIKLAPAPEQAELLKQTLEAANAACNTISQYAWDNKVFNQFDLHKALYYALRNEYKLAAQLTVRCIGKVADSYKADKNTQRVFKSNGSIPYDDRILKYFTDKQSVSIWTLSGREFIPYMCGKQQKELLNHQKGESDLCLRNGEFYLLATCEIDEPTPDQVDRFLGVDRGVVNLATDSEGNIYQGAKVEKNRKWHANRHRILAKVGTKSAKRKLKKMRDKQSRFQKHVNHCIAKELVIRAKRTKQGIALEDLKGINLQTRVRRENRAERGNWAFDQLGQFIRYKARLYGVPYVEVDPRYTLQRCAVCGHTEKANRKSQSEFLCQSCGHTAHADVNAAVNISVKAAVNQLQVSATLSA